MAVPIGPPEIKSNDSPAIAPNIVPKNWPFLRDIITTKIKTKSGLTVPIAARGITVS